MKEEELKKHIDNIIIDGLVKQGAKENAEFEEAMRCLSNEDFREILDSASAADAEDGGFYTVTIPEAEKDGDNQPLSADSRKPLRMVEVRKSCSSDMLIKASIVHDSLWENEDPQPKVRMKRQMVEAYRSAAPETATVEPAKTRSGKTRKVIIWILAVAIVAAIAGIVMLLL